MIPVATCCRGTIVREAAGELRDDDLHNLAARLYTQTQRQRAWAETMIQEAAGQSVVVPS